MAVDTATTAIPVGETGVGRVRRTLTRPLRRAVRFVATSDPDLSRLRHAGTTVLCLAVVAVLVFGLAALTGASPFSAMPALIVTMLSCNAVREPRPGPRAVTILLMVPSAMAAVTVAALTHDVPLVSYVVFVLVAMAAVAVRVIGPRGIPLGMAAFMAYFVAIFTRVSFAQLPDVAVAVAIGALVVIALRYLLRPRHPERDLQRMLRALGVRAGRVLDTLDDGVVDGVIDERLHRTIRSRLAASSSTAAGAEQALDSADHPLVAGLDNSELGVRIFDFQLVLERLHSLTRRVLVDGSLSDGQRRQLSARLRELRREVHTPVTVARSRSAAPTAPVTEALSLNTSATPIVHGHGTHVAPGGTSDSDERIEALARTVRLGFTAWQGIASRGAAASDLAADSAGSPGPLGRRLPRRWGRANAGASAPSSTAPAAPPVLRGRAALPQVARTAVQVGLAAALSIAAGLALSPTRWFWATIAAFVVFVGTSTRGEILTKGWQRIVGTLAGVVLGVLVAGVVGGQLVPSLVLMLASLFVGFYFMQVSSAWMIFGITLTLALLYGLLGEFSIDLLLVRLEETAVGALIGIVVSYVVFPNSTRDAMRARTRDFLGELDSSLAAAAARLAGPRAAAAAPDDARALRSAFVALQTTSRPVTNGWAGVSNRSGSRRSLVIMGACEYHGRALLRLADGAAGAADTAELRAALDRAVSAVLANLAVFTAALDEPVATLVFHPAGDVIDQLEDDPALTDSRPHRALAGVARHLHAIDQSLCGRGSELGAREEPLPA